MSQPEIAQVDVAANRAAAKWTKSELAGRVLWALARLFFRFSPRPFWWWRTGLLRCFGATVGSNVHIYPSVRISIPWNLSIGDGSAVGDRVILYALGPITVGKRVTISQGAHLCAGTHDWRRPDRPLIKPPITVCDDAWICADAFVGPGVTIGAGAILGARAVAMKEVAGGTIVAGNPARVIREVSPG